MRARIVLSSIALAGLCACTPAEDGKPPPAAAPASEPAPLAAPVAEAPTSNGVRGYVVSSWRDEIPRKVDPAWCPGGLNKSELEFNGITKEDLSAAYKAGGREAADKLFPTNGCIDPAGTDDPGFNLVQGVGPVAIAGLDLDGADSKAEGGSGCAHDDFIGPDGETGIDNQHWRLMGCVAAYQPGGLIDNLYEANGFVDGNAAPVLIELTGVDNLRNDDDVELRFFSSGDAVTFDARGKALPDATMTAHDDPRFHSKPVAAKIVDGVLTSEPTADLYIKVKTQTMDNEFHYRDARVRAEVAADGSLKGLIGAYWDGDNLYDAMNRQYIGENHVGRIAAITRGYMCAGMYNAIPRIADGHPDPETGKCTSVSHAVHFEAVPAFVVLPQLAKAQP